MIFDSAGKPSHSLIWAASGRRRLAPVSTCATVTAVPDMIRLIVSTAPLALAHPGHDQTVMGTVKSIKGQHVEVEAKDGKVTVFMLADTTKILRGKVKAAAADIKVGERIVAIGAAHDGDGHPAGALTAKEIRLAAKTGA